MPYPTYGSAGRTFERRDNALADASGPAPEVLGTVSADALKQKLDSALPPPPWEVGQGRDDGDARMFVDVPSEWTLRWINPRLLDQLGWRYWQPVSPSDSRVKVKINSMIAADNTIRRGGSTGDMLAWMYTHWVEARRQQIASATRDLAESVEAKRASLNEEFKRGTFGPYIQAEVKHSDHQLSRDERERIAKE